MKKFFRIILSIIVICLIALMIDLYLLRGYFLDSYSYYSHDENIKREIVESDDLELKVSKEDDFYNIKFKNKSLKPFFTMTYRWDIYFPVNDSIFSLHFRTKNFYPKYKNEYNNNISCGTGLGYFSINPLEEFNKKIKYKQLINTYLNSHYYPNRKSDTIMDLMYNKPLLINYNNKKVELIERKDITKKDSVDFKLYIPVFNYNYKKLTYVKSNSIKVSYKDVVESYIEEEKRTIEELKSF